MKNTNYAIISAYAIISGVIIVIAIIGITSYMGVSQLQNVHMDDSDPILKNITVMSKETINRQYTVTDTDNVSYITSEQNYLKLMKGRNFTVSVSTINNNSGKWIVSSNEIITQKRGK